MANGEHTFTAARNMRAPPWREIVQWILEAWNDLDKDIIVNSFKSCALTLAVDGSEDELIHCLKLKSTLPFWPGTTEGSSTATSANTGE